MLLFIHDIHEEREQSTVGDWAEQGVVGNRKVSLCNCL